VYEPSHEVVRDRVLFHLRNLREEPGFALCVLRVNPPTNIAKDPITEIPITPAWAGHPNDLRADYPTEFHNPVPLTDGERYKMEWMLTVPSRGKVPLRIPYEFVYDADTDPQSGSVSV
jgi:hypothetical protein